MPALAEPQQRAATTSLVQEDNSQQYQEFAEGLLEYVADGGAWCFYTTAAYAIIAAAPSGEKTAELLEVTQEQSKQGEGAAWRAMRDFTTRYVKAMQ